MKNKKLWIAIGVIAVIAILYFLLSGGKKEEKVSFDTAKVEMGNIQTSITATGTIEPVTSVTVGTQVSGIVSRLYVDYNSVVKKGQVIAELDRTNLISELNAQKASLASAQSSLNYQQSNFERYKTLFEKGLVSADEYESALLSYQKAKEQVNTSRESVRKAQTNLGYATITSPIDGVILSKSVEEGQRVSFTVDAFPDDTFEGAVTQVRQEATTESNVVTYEVVISAPNADLKLKPGLTANVTIYTLEKNNVLAVPAKALRFQPNEALLKEGETVEDCEGMSKVWTKEGNVFKAHKVETGTTNGVLTEIVSGVAAGTEVLTDFNITGGEMGMPQGQQTTNPFMPRPGNRNNNRAGQGGQNAAGGQAPRRQ